MTKLEQYQAKENEICEYGLATRKWNSQKFNKMVRELQSLAIEINKENNCYYDNETWITKLNIFYHPNLTGNDLTDYIANELNKLNGVVVERQIIDNSAINYIIYVVTPYTIYSYRLSRGYGHQASFGATGKSYSNKIVVTEHICELVYADHPSLETLRNEFKIDILTKDKNAKFEPEIFDNPNIIRLSEV